jgi:hypothetical protein
VEWSVPNFPRQVLLEMNNPRGAVRGGRTPIQPSLGVFAANYAACEDVSRE